MITLAPTELFVKPAGRLAVRRNGAVHDVRGLVVPRRAVEIIDTQHFWVLPTTSANFGEHYLALAVSGGWHTINECSLCMAQRERVAGSVLGLYWAVVHDRYALTTASTSALGVDSTGSVGVADAGVVIADPAGKLARNTAYHLLRVAIEVCTGGRCQCLLAQRCWCQAVPSFTTTT